MKIIVTGALGHIGSKLIRNLPFAFPNLDIILIDNLSTQRYCSLFDLPNEGNFKFIPVDIVTENIEELFEDVLVVIHLAAITDATNSFKNKKLIEENNFHSTKILADICSKRQIQMIYLSSTSVYGTQKDTVDENCNLTNLKPQSPYATIKLKEENYLKSYGLTNNLKFTILRFGTIFGISRGMRFHTAVNKFCWQAVVGQSLTVWSTALNQKRPYLDLNDAINSIIFVIKNNLFCGEIYNVVTCNETVKNIISYIQKSVKNINIQYVDNEIMNQLSYNVLNKKIIRCGFKFEGNIEKGIYETIQTLKNINFQNKIK